jgi:serine/threonine protein kinase
VDSSRAARLKEILQAVAALSEPERSVFLDEACKDDPDLRREVESVLAHESDPTTPGWTTGAASSGLDSHPTEIGPYRILERIGEGGMGVVYLAEQTEPVRRRVALKVIKLGMDTKQVVARFEAERQALAMMDHPNIARVLDAGATPDGRPYFVMECVQGIPITDYCDLHNLKMPERLELFTQICEAVQHAHQKGVIHRDLKPSNVLVEVMDDHPVPKVIDFGVAKATAHQLTGSADRDAGVHEPRAGRDDGPERRHADGHLLAGSVAVPTPGGSIAVRAGDVAYGGLRGDSPDPAGGGSAEAEHAVELVGCGHRDCGEAPSDGPVEPSE